MRVVFWLFRAKSSPKLWVGWWKWGLLRWPWQIKMIVDQVQSLKAQCSILRKTVFLFKGLSTSVRCLANAPTNLLFKKKEIKKNSQKIKSGVVDGFSSHSEQIWMSSTWLLCNMTHDERACVTVTTSNARIQKKGSNNVFSFRIIAYVYILIIKWTSND